MNFREEKFKKTKQSLFDALERLISGDIKNTELKDKRNNGKLKINRSSVEKEAEFSVGVLRNHPDVVDAIKLSIKNEKIKKLDIKSTDELSDIELDSKNESLQKIKKQKIEQKDEIFNLNNAMSNQLAQHQMLMVALTNELNEHQKEKVFIFKK